MPSANDNIGQFGIRPSVVFGPASEPFGGPG